MCGLVGVMGAISLNNIKMFNDLMLVSAFRGTDSSGVIIGREIESKMDFSYLKAAVHPHRFTQTRPYRQQLWGDIKVLAGHTRAATVGARNTDNAHPFASGGIIGMHNGTVHSGISKDVDGTDSEAIFKALSEKDIPDVISGLGGAFALVWIDKDKNTLNFIRNHARPLWMGTNLSKTEMMWASERAMIELIMARSYAPNYSTIVEIRPFLHYSYPMADMRRALDDVVKTEIKEVKTYYSGPFYQYEYAGIEETPLWLQEQQKQARLMILRRNERPASTTEMNSSTSVPALPGPDTPASSPDQTQKSYSSVPRISLKSISAVKTSTNSEELAKQPSPKFLYKAGNFTPKARESVSYGPKYRYFTTYTDFCDHLRQGCQNCTYEPDPIREFDKPVWFSKTKFVCDDCFREDTIKEWIDNGSMLS